MDQPTMPTVRTERARTDPDRSGQVRPRRLLLWTGMLIVYLVWGSTYVGIKVAIETTPPLLMAAFRFIIAGSVLLAWSLARDRGSFEMPSRRQWRDAAIVGFLLLGGGNGIIAWGETTVASGVAALLVAMVPLWLVVFGRLIYREGLPRLAGIGIVLGLAGVAILVWPFGAVADTFSTAGIAALIFAPICWANGSLFSAHRAQLPSRPLVSTGIQMLAGGILLAAMGTASGELGALHLERISQASLIAFAYLTTVGSLLAFTTYAWLLRVAPLPLVGTYAYVNPVVAVLLGAFILGEPITPRILVASAVIVVAVALVITVRSRMARSGAAEEPETRTAGARTGPAAVLVDDAA
ncbi:MAG TPA: EamA family transporter [Candidatus Limnocylindrales bacterium]